LGVFSQPELPEGGLEIDPAEELVAVEVVYYLSNVGYLRWVWQDELVHHPGSKKGPETGRTCEWSVESWNEGESSRSLV